MFKVYGEELDFVFTEVRKKGCRQLVIDGKRVDICGRAGARRPTTSRDMDAVVDRFVVGRKHEKAIKAGIAATLLVGDGLMQVDVLQGRLKGRGRALLHSRCAARRTTSSTATSSPSTSCSTIPESACRTCGGLGVHKITHPELLVPDPKRSIRGGCFVQEAYKYNPDTWDGRMMYSLSKAAEILARHPVGGAAGGGAPRHPLRHRRRRRSRCTLPPECQGEARRFGTAGGRLRRHRAADRAAIPALPAARRSQLRHGGVARQGDGGAHLPRLQRRAPARHAAAVHRRRQDHPRRRRSSTSTSCTRFSAALKPTGRGADAGRQVLGEIRGRLELLLGIGLDYLNLNRRSGTLSGGESQRIRLSTQIGSGLMGMLYVLDEPSIGLHPKDNVKMIATLESLRDIGNTVIVVEHDEDTIRAADHIVEMGPGPGVHGGEVVVQGTLDDMLACKASPTGPVSLRQASHRDAARRRRRATARRWSVRGARENNLKIHRRRRSRWASWSPSPAPRARARAR